VKAQLTGITVLGSELFIVGDPLSAVDVYDANSFDWKHKLKIPGSKWLQSIVACKRTNCLYISDVLQNIIYRHQFDCSKNVLSNWSVGEECGGLSVTRSYSVLVTLYDVKKVQEYTPDGCLIRKIKLDSSIESPLLCIQLSMDRFVVCYGLLETDERQVCIIDTSGHIVQSYGGPRGSDIGQMKTPRHLIVDTHGHVMVADPRNNRVELLSPTLTHLGYIQIPGHHLLMPCAICLDKLNHRLYIGEKIGGRILVLGAYNLYATVD